MLTPSTPVATSLSYDSTPTAKAATVAADARDDFRQQMATAHDDEVRAAGVAAAARVARERAAEVPNPMSSLSTIAVAGALNSLPQALEMMRSIAIQSAAGTLSDADRQALHAEYAQLSAQAVSMVGSVAADQQAQMQAREERRQDNAEPAWRENGDDRRSTLTQTRVEPRESETMAPVERTVTVQRQTVVAAGHGEQRDPRVDVRSHEIHVGNDDYQPVAERQSVTHPTAPATFARIEMHAESQHVFSVQAAQVTQFVQVAQAELVAPRPELAVA